MSTHFFSIEQLVSTLSSPKNLGFGNAVWTAAVPEDNLITALIDYSAGQRQMTNLQFAAQWLYILTVGICAVYKIYRVNSWPDPLFHGKFSDNVATNGNINSI